MSMLDVRGLTKSFPAHTVLAGLDLHADPGSLTAILAPSGAGKTTLLRLVAGFEHPDEGTIAIGDRPVCDGTRALAPERRGVGYVAQEGALFPHLNVAANIAFGLHRSHRRARRGVAELLDLVGLERRFADRRPDQLSGGEQQRVALARALAPRPALMLLDEPFSALDAAQRPATRRAVLASLRTAGVTTVMVTHDQTEALAIADRVAVLLDGRIAQTGAPGELYDRPATPAVARFLGDAVLLPATVHGGVAACPLGRLCVAGPASDGPAQVMVRPEQISLAPASGEERVRACVVGHTFYGHDADVELTLPGSPTTVRARQVGGAIPAVDQRVDLSVEGTVMAYPAPSAAAP